MIRWNLMLKGWAISLALTLIFELSYALFWGVRERRDLLLDILVNVLTNPVVVFVFYYVRFKRLQINYGLVTLVMEVLAVVVEALLYRKFARTIKRPWLFALSANAFSYAMGELVNGVF